MKSMKEKAYDKLCKYVNREYPGEDISWYVDVETEDEYIMRAWLPDSSNRRIAINYKTNEVTDEVVVDSYFI